MAAQLPKPAVLDDAKLSKVKDLEHQLGDGVAVVAYAKPFEAAELSEEQLKRVRELEGELGVLLVAWRDPNTGCA